MRGGLKDRIKEWNISVEKLFDDNEKKDESKKIGFGIKMDLVW